MSTIQPTAYTVYPTGYAEMVHSDKHTWTLRVELRDHDHDRWSVVGSVGALSRGGAWDYEPLPSSRTERWLKSHRFTLGEALRRAERVVDELKVNMMTAQEASDWVAARRTTK